MLQFNPPGLVHHAYHCPLLFCKHVSRKEIFRSPFLVHCRCVTFVPPNVVMIKLCSLIPSPRSEVFSNPVFPAVDKVHVPATALSKLFRIYMISSEGPESKIPISNAHVLEVVMFILLQSLILIIFLSLIFTSLLIIGIGGDSILA